LPENLLLSLPQLLRVFHPFVMTVTPTQLDLFQNGLIRLEIVGFGRFLRVLLGRLLMLKGRRGLQGDSAWGYQGVCI
jgi:hypothetical protein